MKRGIAVCAIIGCVIFLFSHRGRAVDAKGLNFELMKDGNVVKAGDYNKMLLQQDFYTAEYQARIEDVFNKDKRTIVFVSQTFYDVRTIDTMGLGIIDIIIKAINNEIDKMSKNIFPLPDDSTKTVEDWHVKATDFSVYYVGIDGKKMKKIQDIKLDQYGQYKTLNIRMKGTYALSLDIGTLSKFVKCSIGSGLQEFSRAAENDLTYSGKKNDPYGKDCLVCPKGDCTCCMPDNDNKCDHCDCNFCSSIGKKIDLNYDRIFSMPCGRHDCCYAYGYATYHLDQGNCDEIFNYETCQACYNKFMLDRGLGTIERHVKYAACIVLADKMYQAVSQFGAPHVILYKKQRNYDYLHRNK